MSNCTQSLLIVPMHRKEHVLENVQRIFKAQSPYMMDNWGLYKDFSDGLSIEKNEIRIGYLEYEKAFMIRASHPNYPPHSYVDYAKSIRARLLFQDLDGYGESVTWDIASENKKSNFLYTIEFLAHYPNYTPFTEEFLGLGD